MEKNTYLGLFYWFSASSCLVHAFLIFVITYFELIDPSCNFDYKNMYYLLLNLMI